jgi:hypothetical protein
MGKSKRDPKRKSKLVAFKKSIQDKKKKIQKNFMKIMEENQQKQMQEKILANQTDVVDGVEELGLDESIEVPSYLGDVQQVELTGAPPDAFAGVIR